MPPLNSQTSLLGAEKNLALLTGEKTLSPRNDPVSAVMVRNRDPEKDDHSKEEMAVGADSANLVDGNMGIGQAGPWVACRVDGSLGGSIRNRLEFVIGLVALSHGLNIEPESMVNLAFVKNDSYEKGPDSVVVHVYVKEICRDTSRVLFREQDFTLIFQTRCVAVAGTDSGPQVGIVASSSYVFSLPCSASAGMEIS